MIPTLLQASLFLALVLLLIIRETEQRAAIRERDLRITQLLEGNKDLQGQLDLQQARHEEVWRGSWRGAEL